MSRPASIILTAVALALPLATAAGVDQAPKPDSPPTAQELRAQVREWQQSFHPARESSAKPPSIKFVPVAGPGGKMSGEHRFDLPDGCYYFSAKSVAACQRMLPTIERLRRQGFRIVNVEVGAAANVSHRYAIKTVPTILIKHGADVVKLTGLQEEASLRTTLLQHHLQDSVPRIAKANDPDEMRVIIYRVGNLPRPSQPGDRGPPKPDFDPLIHLIVSVVEPESWDESGGPGKIVPMEKTLSVVVRQTRRVHAQIRIVLDELRRLEIEDADEK